MDYLPIIVAILIVDLLALISPGPNFVLVSSAAVSKSRGHALWTAFGISTGSFIWAAGAALGIASVLEALPLLGTILKVAGILYLLYLGLRLLRSKGFQPPPSGRGRDTDARAGFWRGLLINMTNPKSAAYYASVFAAFLTPDMPIWVVFVLILAIAAMSLIWHVILAVGFSAPRVQSRYISVSKYVDWACGGVLVLLGLRLALDNR